MDVDCSLYGQARKNSTAELPAQPTFAVVPREAVFRGAGPTGVTQWPPLVPVLGGAPFSDPRPWGTAGTRGCARGTAGTVIITPVPCL